MIVLAGSLIEVERSTRSPMPLRTRAEDGSLCDQRKPGWGVRTRARPKQSTKLVALRLGRGGPGDGEHLPVRRARSHAVTFLALTAAALVGCGSSASSTGLTHAELVARADAICGQANNRIAAVKKLPALGAGLPYAYVLGLLHEELPIVTAEVSALRRLTPSHGDQDSFGAHLRAVAAELAVAERVRDASATKNASGYQGATLELVTLSARSVQAATRVGLIECAKRPEPKG